MRGKMLEMLPHTIHSAAMSANLSVAFGTTHRMPAIKFEHIINADLAPSTLADDFASDGPDHFAYLHLPEEVLECLSRLSKLSDRNPKLGPDMYNDDVTRVPRDETEMWTVLWKQFEFVRHVLWELEIETKEEALANAYHREAAGKTRRDGMHVIRYRDTGDGLDQREHYLDMGRELLPYIHQSIDEQTLTPEFVQQWGKLMFCHGYIASYVFDDTDDLSDVRKGHGGRKDNQRRWIAHMLKMLIDHGHDAEEARAIVGRYVRRLVANKRYPQGFGEKWFRKMVDSEGALSSSYDAQHMYPKRIEELADGELENLPPLPPLTAFEQVGNPK